VYLNLDGVPSLLLHGAISLSQACPKRRMITRCVCSCLHLAWSRTSKCVGLLQSGNPPGKGVEGAFKACLASAGSAQLLKEVNLENTIIPMGTPVKEHEMYVKCNAMVIEESLTVLCIQE